MKHFAFLFLMLMATVSIVAQVKQADTKKQPVPDSVFAKEQAAAKKMHVDDSLAAYEKIKDSVCKAEEEKAKGILGTKGLPPMEYVIAVLLLIAFKLFPFLGRILPTVFNSPFWQKYIEKSPKSAVYVQWVGVAISGAALFVIAIDWYVTKNVTPELTYAMLSCLTLGTVLFVYAKGKTTPTGNA